MKLFTVDLEMDGISKYHIAISGFRGCNIDNDVERLFERVRELEHDQEVLAVQLFDADRIATHLHLLVSAIYAIRAFRKTKNISSTLGTEALLYASAHRQITDAISKVGVGPRSKNLAALIISSLRDSAIRLIGRLGIELRGLVDDSVLDTTERHKVEDIKTVFNISDRELEASELGVNPLDIQAALARRIISRISIMAISK